WRSASSTSREASKTRWPSIHDGSGRPPTRWPPGTARASTRSPCRPPTRRASLAGRHARSRARGRPARAGRGRDDAAGTGTAQGVRSGVAGRARGAGGVRLSRDCHVTGSNVRYASRMDPSTRSGRSGTGQGRAGGASRSRGCARPLRWLAILAVATLGACAHVSLLFDRHPPVVFVHGNGDSSALWQTTLWRFESNGWPPERLHAVDMPYPRARDDDSVPQPGRSSTDDQLKHLSAEVDRVLARTGARKVVLVGNSRGGFAIRNYVQNGEGAQTVRRAILGRTPNHGIWASDYMPGSEFNGKGPFLTALNAPKGTREYEIAAGPSWLTLRSDNNDKYAQPDGRWIGRPGMATHVGYDGPALRGATNVVL